MGNIYYTTKVLGTKTGIMDKILFGWLFMIVYLGLLIAPVLIFSDYGYFITLNPIHKAEIDLSFIVHKKIDNASSLSHLGSVANINEEMKVNESFIVY
jgi:hypothetical protein